MDNPYSEYYIKQAGSGISVYSGHRYQTGGGFFGKILKYLKPALKYIGRRGLDTITNIGSDFLNGENIVNSGQKQLLNTARDVLTDARTSLDQYKKKRQTGEGVKRRSRSVSKQKTASRSRSRSRKRAKTTKKLYKKKPKSKKKTVKKVEFF